MNCLRKRSLNEYKLNFNSTIIVSIIGVLIFFTACSSSTTSSVDDEIIDEPPLFPSLMIANQNTDGVRITVVGLVGYQFDNLGIDQSESQTFDLDDGMPGGYNDININVSYRRANRTFNLSIKKDFIDGEITTVRFRGCINSEGCPGFFLE